MTALNLPSLSLLLLGLAYATKGTIVTDGNHDAPVFEKSGYVVELAENAEIGEEIVRVVAHDSDEGINGVVSYYLGHPSDNEMFTLNSQTGLLTSNMVVDREVYIQVNLIILAVDGGDQPMTGTTLVVVRITDVNDNAPVFEQSGYVVQLAENAQIGEEIVRVAAHDSDEGINGVVSYSLGHPSDNEMFTLNSQTGLLTSNMVFDREVYTQVNLIILAVDGGDQPMTGTTSVMVLIADVNDNAPELVTSEFSITEGNTPGRYVGRLVYRDRDVGINREVEFSMKIVSPRLPFHVSPDGQIRTASYSDIDREIQDTYILEILMKDKGTPSLTSTASVTVHVSDGR